MSAPLFRPGEHEFRMLKARFTNMPLARVAKYMKEIAKLAGPKARFVRITPTKIVFTVVADQAKEAA